MRIDQYVVAPPFEDATPVPPELEPIPGMDVGFEAEAGCNILVVGHSSFVVEGGRLNDVAYVSLRLHLVNEATGREKRIFRVGVNFTQRDHYGDIPFSAGKAVPIGKWRVRAHAYGATITGKSKPYFKNYQHHSMIVQVQHP